MQYADDHTINPEEYRAFGEDDKSSIEGAGTFLRNAQVCKIHNNIQKIHLQLCIGLQSSGSPTSAIKYQYFNVGM